MSNLTKVPLNDCDASLPDKALEGLELFNKRQYFDAHEALETAWRDETRPIRNLYRGILQAAVVYLHLTNRNYPGVIKVYQRCQKWLEMWPETCRGVSVGQLRRDLETVIAQVEQLGQNRISEFDISLIKPVIYVKKRSN
jgi:predicted metal-dependent hydrolase